VPPLLFDPCLCIRSVAAAGLALLDGDRSPVADAVRLEFIAHLGSVEANAEEGEARRFAHRDIHVGAVQAAREVVIAMRANEEIGDDAFHQLEEELDWIEMASGWKEDDEPES